MEEWRNIDGFENYEVSNEGRVRSVDHEVEQLNNGVLIKHQYKGKVLKPKEDKRGYLWVGLHQDGKQFSKTIHSLVANAFIPNENSLPQVNHRNEDKHDNRVENLEMCTAKYNSNYGSRTERSAKARINNTKQSKPVAQFTLDDELVRTWPSAIEAGRNGFIQSAVSNCCNGKVKTHKGFKWKYIN